MDHPVDVTIDAKGQKCPMPVLLTSRAAKQLAPGQVMLVEATDKGSQSDIPAWARDTGNELLESSSEDGVFRYLIRKG
ncbi:MAG TPA: sulfurtransferase TusA family protein [Marmoricola sp.]|nr:sulfurtransferase TusA family protein [Marmoricola sp.]